MTTTAAKNGKWSYLNPYRSNPWFQLHLDSERAYNSGTPFAVWSRFVVREFYGHEWEKPRTCGICGKEAGYYRATIGAYQCTNCRALYISQSGKWRD